jgi:hypothetical protein
MAQDPGDIDPYGGPEQFFDEKDDVEQPEMTDAESGDEKASAAVEPEPVDMDSDSLEMMQGVCGSTAKSSTRRNGSTDEIERNAVCPSCPEGASNQDGSLTLYGGWTADFDSDGNREAILDTGGCGGGRLFQDSTVVLRKKEGGWELLEYVDALNSGTCEPVPDRSGPRLMCSHTESGQGASQTKLSLRWVADDELAVEHLIELHDNSGACFFAGNFKTDVAVRVIEDIDEDGRTEIAFGVVQYDGKPKTDGVLEDVEKRCERENYDIETTRDLRVFEVTSDGVEPDAEAATDTLHPELIEFRKTTESDDEQR